ncbi:MAG TPA: hypothetical protein VJ984_01610 [Xanthomonadales bacterium]|nr:hypothetical protein [Xanthomonadales bacterium]
MRALFLPDYPDREFYTIIPIFMRLGWFATQDPDDEFDFAICWQDQTWVKPDEHLLQIAGRKPVLNLRCLDISKRRVEKEFIRAFGRSSFVDPLSFSGRAVCKFDENALGGEIVDLPIVESEEGRVYQMLIDSSQDGAMLEYRVPIILGDIPVVYLEQKDLPVNAIKTRKRSVALDSPGAIFSSKEVQAIRAMCHGMGLDFGELDVLRSNADGALYVLDVNKTPGGFGIMNRVNWRHEQRLEAIARLADSLASGIQRALGEFD